MHALRAVLPPVSARALGDTDNIRRLELHIELGKVELERTLLVTRRAPRVLARAGALGAKPAQRRVRSCDYSTRL